MTSALVPVGPIVTLHLFDDLHADLIRLLRSLSPAEWAAPTVCTDWTVKDLTAHLLDTSLRRVAGMRDRHVPPPPPFPVDEPEALLRFLNLLNAEFVSAMRRVSPRILTDWTEEMGYELTQVLAARDPFAPSSVAVSWAGDQESPNWFDTAREFTERWLHQQQIRDAVGRPDLQPRYLAPVLDTFLRALPHTYRDRTAAEGTAIAVQITGAAGGDWTLQRDAAAWQLYRGSVGGSAVRITLGENTAWRLLTKGLTRQAALTRTLVTGDAELAAPFFDAVAIMA